MARSLTRSMLATAFACGIVAAGAAPASATSCVGTASIEVVCVRNVPVYRECVFLGGPTCTWVEVDAPLCIYNYGPLANGSTVWC
jgi:hypothetical protein